MLDEKAVSTTATGNFEASDSAAQKVQDANRPVLDVVSGRPRIKQQICLGRGDKGICVRIMARSQKAYDFLKEYLTAQHVKNLFQELCHGEVTRYELPNMKGFNFLLDGALGGGGTKTLRLDAQGKTFAQALIGQRAPIPADVLKDCE